MNLRMTSTSNYTIKILFFLTVFFLTACSFSNNNYLFGNVATFPPSAYFNWAASASQEELTIEKLRLETARSSGSDPISTVQYAIILSLEDDDTGVKAQEVNNLLLEELVQQDTSSERNTNAYITFGSIWKRQIELQILNDNANYDNSQADSRIRILEDKVQSLESTIRAFTDIEQELIERDEDEDTQ